MKTIHFLTRVLTAACVLVLTGISRGSNLPDLVPVALGPEYTPTAHTYMGLSFRVENQGSAPAEGDNWMRVYFSDDDVLDTAKDSLVWEVLLPTLDPGRSLRGLVGGAGDRGSGNYFLVVDADSQIAELDETNNVLFANFVIGPLFNLSHLEVATPAVSGANAGVDLLFQNFGNDDGVVNYAIYLSKEGLFDPSASQKLYEGHGESSFFRNEFGEVNTSVQGAFSVRIPEILAGAYRLLVVYSSGQPTGNKVDSFPVSITTQLRIERESGAVRISWPAFAGEGQLEFTEALSPTSTWLPVPQPPALDKGRFVVKAGDQGVARVYRLKFQ